MPWYKSGTVAVTLNSNAVIGTGTAFLANGRVGDAFRGPDGGWYEVTNIASDTAMSISPTYRSASASAGSYALAPMQGYVKDSADALRSLVNTYGAKLAAMGTAAAVDIQTSVIDPTAGRAMLNGAWGWGSVSADNPLDLNAIAVSQKFGVNTGAANIPWALGSTTVPFAAGSSGIAMTWTANHQSQIIVNRTAAMVALRRKNAGAWAPDDYFCLYPTGKTFLDVTQGGTGNATGTAPKLAAAAILGTVSQSGGVPTGALMEYINNANGQAYKFACGLMIAVRFVPAQPFNVAPGTVNFRNDIPMPVTFAGSVHRSYSGYVTDSQGNRFGLPIIDDSASSGNNGVWACAVYNSTPTPMTQILSLQLTAIGRWF